MGEKSRETGEQGEKLVRRLLDVMGWTPAESNLTINCARPAKHAQKEGSTRQTHGIDFLYSYRSPLVEFTEKIVSISVKSTSKVYKSSLSSDFRSYVIDACQAVECLQHSQKLAEIKSSRRGDIIHYDACSVIFFLSLGENGLGDIRSKLWNINIPTDLKFSSIQLVDNAAASFIYDTIKYAQSNYDKFEFDYNLLSQNYLDEGIPYSSRVMPAEFLTSPLIYLRLEKNTGESSFCISTSEAFERENFQRMLSLATDLTRKLSKRLTFLYRFYNETNDRSVVDSVLAQEGERASGLTVTVAQLGQDFRGLLND